jgi:hypothetical protein
LVLQKHRTAIENAVEALKRQQNNAVALANAEVDRFKVELQSKLQSLVPLSDADKPELARITTSLLTARKHVDALKESHVNEVLSLQQSMEAELQTSLAAFEKRVTNDPSSIQSIIIPVCLAHGPHPLSHMLQG